MSYAEYVDSTFYKTNVSNYSGVFQTGVDYRQFDFVYNTGDARFYYAKEDVLYGGVVSISESERYSLIPASAGGSQYILDTFNRTDDINATLRAGYIIDLSGSATSDGRYEILDVEKNAIVNNVSTLTGSAIKVKGVGSSEISSEELASTNNLNISVVNADPSIDPDVWSTDNFFFDPDYGSTVSFRADNLRYQYGNGYFIVQPRNINSLTFEADLTFKNRNNREANAIIHFVENHQGQHEADAPSPNLIYKQGISGFRWDGDSTFHPYDSVENQSRNFYCSNFSHTLNFENTNDISLKIRNLDASILRKSEQIFVNKAPDYDPAVNGYDENDVVFSSVNNRFYYCKSGFNQAGKDPVEKKATWTREDGYFKDLNKDVWSREFFWKPSVGLTVDQNPRTKEIALGGYTQQYSDGINESLLKLSLNFNNRSDEEAYAILHFLEQHYGSMPFLFTPPAPYDSSQNFICESWTHTYVYKNNHNISVEFEQYPFNMTAQEIDNNSTPPETSDAELIFQSPISFSKQDDGEVLRIGQKVKRRVNIKNVGDENLGIYGISVGSPFELLDGSSSNLPIVPYDVPRDKYFFQIPTNAPVNIGGFDLRGRVIKLSKSYSEGISDGGQMFTVLTGQAGQDYTDWRPEVVNNVKNCFYQNNLGQIKSGINENVVSDYVDCDHFVSRGLALQYAAINGSYLEISGGQSSWFDVGFNADPTDYENISLALSDGSILNTSNTSPDNINVTIGGQVIEGIINIQNDGRHGVDDGNFFPSQYGRLKVYIEE